MYISTICVRKKKIVHIIHIIIGIYNLIEEHDNVEIRSKDEQD